MYYGFAYDGFGNTTAIGLADSSGAIRTSLATYEYYPGNGQVKKMTFGNGSYVLYAYDIFDRLVQESFYQDASTPTQIKHYRYNSEGVLAESWLTDASGQETQRYRYEYDSLGRLIRSQQADQGAVTQSTQHLYDDANRLSSQSWTLGNRTFTERYTYNTANGNLTSAYMGTGRYMNFTYDNLQRVTRENMVGIYNRSYTYKNLSSTQTTAQVSKLQYAADGSGMTGATFTYTYDAMGNIASVTGPRGSSNSVRSSYAYDALNQLTSETNGSETYTYTYDTAGNIQTVIDPMGSTWKEFTYAYEQSVTSNDTYWNDLLKTVKINGVAKNLEYDTIGNPTTYFNGTVWNFTWQNGRQMATAKNSAGTRELSFTYGVDGIRTSKTINGVTHHYINQNGKVIREYWTQNGSEYILDFFYDVNGKPLALYYRKNGTSTAYYYQTNLQGDVMKIFQVTSSGGVATATPVASYAYDAWGNEINIPRYAHTGIPGFQL